MSLEFPQFKVDVTNPIPKCSVIVFFNRFCKLLICNSVLLQLESDRSIPIIVYFRNESLICCYYE